MIENELREIGARIRALREIAGLTQAQAAEKTDVSLEEYRLLEAGKKDFAFTFVYKAANTFGVEIKDLLSGTSPNLSLYTVVRKGGGLPIARRTGFKYENLAPSFKDKLAEPFFVTIPHSETEPVYTRHFGQEIDIVIRGRLEITVQGGTEVLNPGDTIYYDSSAPHALRALDGKDCELYAVVIRGKEKDDRFEMIYAPTRTTAERAETRSTADEYIETETDERGTLKKIRYKNTEKFNYAFDILDRVADKCPDKTAMVWVGGDRKSRTFAFRDMKRYSNMTANFLESLGVKKGDRTMLILKRHYQFWFAILALHKIGAIVIPATNQLVKKDLTYRFRKAGVGAVLCTADGETAAEVEKACAETGDMLKILVGGKREGWHDFDSEMRLCSDAYARKPDAACGDDIMAMLFTSGTSAFPRLAAHTHKYPLGHYVTAKYWQNVNPSGLHFTVSETGWAKSLWGKLYGQWMCEAPIFVYDFDKFDADDVLKMFAKYKITTFCAPPTVYRIFIKEDLSKYDLSSIEYAVTAGEALNPEVFCRFYEATGLKIMEAYGQTETTVTVVNLVGTSPKVGRMGKPSPAYDVRLLNASGAECKPGEIGEICVRCDDKDRPCGLMLEYCDDAALNESAFRDGFYHTGDQATRDEEGYFCYVGRIDDLIKSSGYRIGPFEIESVIMELPYVLECAITAAPDAIRGQVVKATIVLTKGVEGTDALKKEIQNYVKRNTAPYKYPRIVEFVAELPKTISGKIRRIEIREKDSNKTQA